MVTWFKNPLLKYIVQTKSIGAQKLMCSNEFSFILKWTWSFTIENPLTEDVHFDLWRGNSCFLLAGGPVKRPTSFWYGGLV